MKNKSVSLLLAVIVSLAVSTLLKSAPLPGSEPAHVKDEARFPGKWAFFIFGDSKTARMVPTNMECYSCHAQHAAVDTTFVQFYPTLLPIAQSKGTLSAAYQKETAGQK